MEWWQGGKQIRRSTRTGNWKTAHKIAETQEQHIEEQIVAYFKETIQTKT